ncbi:hypothetical protein [Magnetococcus sp. PR-3]|uniref:hypothetical protein n=1 Tax=Magnetococcus sp. PR-3 TaxID=3120355 RepID=UPI002FCE3C15
MGAGLKVLFLLFFLLSLGLTPQTWAQSARLQLSLVTAPPAMEVSAQQGWDQTSERSISTAAGPLRLQGLYDPQFLYIRLSFADSQADQTPGYLQWDEAFQSYRSHLLPIDRVALISWFPQADKQQKGDLWIWSALAGHGAEDATVTCSRYPFAQAEARLNDHGGLFYQKITPDPGTAPYRLNVPKGKQTPKLPRTVAQTATGSRADILTYSQWLDGQWTILFKIPRQRTDPNDLPLQGVIPLTLLIHWAPTQPLCEQPVHLELELPPPTVKGAL